MSRILMTHKESTLVETSFLKHIDLINTVVAQASPELVKRPPITVFNKKVNQPRDVGFFSDESKGYFYSGQVMESKPMTPEMKNLLQILNEHYGAEYNGFLVNRYQDGQDRVGAHSDSEAGLDPKSGVVAISWGAERIFRIREKVPGKTGKILKDVITRHGFAIQMRGSDFQKNLTHEIVAEARVTKERISITARKHDLLEEAKQFEAHRKKDLKRKRE